MNAYELAEKLEYDYWHAKANITMFKSADMLRQQEDLLQQHEKHNLELQEIIKNQKERIAELEKRAEPAAWMHKESGQAFAGLGSPMKPNDFIPLYTTPQIKELSDRELVVFLMDEIDRASEWLVDGETHMAIGVLGQCHAKIRKHLSNTKESE